MYSLPPSATIISKQLILLFKKKNNKLLNEPHNKVRSSKGIFESYQKILLLTVKDLKWKMKLGNTASLLPSVYFMDKSGS